MEIEALRSLRHLLGDSTVEDVEMAVERYGYLEDDFKFTVRQEPPSPHGQHLMKDNRTVEVTYAKTGLTRSYSDGWASAFAADFERDLSSDIFT